MTHPELTALIAEGWSIVPIATGTKAPTDPSWEKKTYTPDDFRPEDNVGAKCGAPSGWRVDVDCDCPEAVAAARELLPHTRRHGRPSNPDSHHWYLSPGSETLQLHGLNREMLIELRANGQTVIPSSIHTSGEKIAWSNPEQAPLVIAPDDLRKEVIGVAICALVARSWPEGNRHNAALHLGGFLARAGYDAPAVERMASVIAQAADDEEWRDRARAARESAEKHARGDKTTGGPALKNLLERGDEVLRLINTWLGRQGDDALDQLNARYFVVRVGKDVLVADTEALVPEDTLRRSVSPYVSFEAFEKLHCNRKMGKQSLGQFWLRHPQRLEKAGVLFAPPPHDTKVPEGYYNLWRGFAVEPDTAPHPERRCARFLAHVHDVVASGNQAHADYILDLFADCVRVPGKPIGKALALRGGQGVGKSLTFEALGKLFGRAFISVNNREQIIGKFNAHLSGKVVVFADEAIWGGRKEDVGTFKHLITQTEIPIQRKGIDIVSERNCIHLFLATNEVWAAPAGALERRVVALDVTVRRPQSYFDILFEEIDSPTFAPALLAYLLARVPDYPRLRAGLDTAALREQQDLSASQVTRWWLDRLEDGEITRNSGEWPVFASSDVLYERYVDDMGSVRGTGESRRVIKGQFIRELRHLLPPRVGLVPMRISVNVNPPGLPPNIQSRIKRGLRLPTLDECREFYDRAMGTTGDWPPPLVEQEPLPLEREHEPLGDL